MQLCKCINFFLKTHNKQINQYCLNFTIFFTQKKKFKKNGWGSSRVVCRVGLTRKKHGSDHGSTRFCFRSKKSSSSRVFFWLGWVRKFLPVLSCLPQLIVGDLYLSFLALCSFTQREFVLR